MVHQASTASRSRVSRGPRRPPRPASGLGALGLALALLTGLLAEVGCQVESEADAGASADSTAADADSTDARPSARASRERTISVEAADVVRGDLVLPIIAEGRIESRYRAELEAEVRGRLLRLAVNEGDHVRKGQLIAEIDPREYQIEVDERESEYRESLARLAAEGVDVSELRAALDSPDTGTDPDDPDLSDIEREFEAIRSGAYRKDVVVARSGIAGARAALLRARLDLERTAFRAPFAGIVENLTIAEGEQVAVGTTICSIVNERHLRARVNVLESDLKGLVAGRPCLLEITALGDTVSARVDVVGSTVDPDTRTCHVLVELDNADGSSKPGMYVRAAIAGDVLHDRLMVPHEAILTRDGRPLVFRVEDDRSKWVYVELGARNESMIEIAEVLQGGSLTDGDQVVVENHLTLAHDAKIKVKRVRPTVDPWAID